VDFFRNSLSEEHGSTVNPAEDELKLGRAALVERYLSPFKGEDPEPLEPEELVGGEPLLALTIDPPGCVDRDGSLSFSERTEPDGTKSFCFSTHTPICRVEVDASRGRSQYMLGEAVHRLGPDCVRSCAVSGAIQKCLSVAVWTNSEGEIIETDVGLQDVIGRIMTPREADQEEEVQRGIRASRLIGPRYRVYPSCEGGIRLVGEAAVVEPAGGSTLLVTLCSTLTNLALTRWCIGKRLHLIYLRSSPPSKGQLRRASAALETSVSCESELWAAAGRAIGTGRVGEMRCALAMSCSGGASSYSLSAGIHSRFGEAYTRFTCQLRDPAALRNMSTVLAHLEGTRPHLPSQAEVTAANLGGGWQTKEVERSYSIGALAACGPPEMDAFLIPTGEGNLHQGWFYTVAVPDAGIRMQLVLGSRNQPASARFTLGKGARRGQYTWKLTQRVTP